MIDTEKLSMKIAKNIDEHGMRCFSQGVEGTCYVWDIDDLANDIIKPVIEATLLEEAEDDLQGSASCQSPKVTGSKE